MAWYTVRQEAGVYCVINFDNLFFVERIYKLWAEDNQIRCTCPAGMRGCRHVIIFSIFCEWSRVDTGWFFDYDNEVWHPPLSQTAWR